MNLDKFINMEPMRYYDNPEPKTAGAVQKRLDMINNKDQLYIATEKHDGDWAMFVHGVKGENHIRSRSLSKITGQYGDYTLKLPHLVAEMDTWPDNTVVLAEVCWNEYGTNANTVGTILRCLPVKAVERQQEKKLFGLVFDILMYDSEDLIETPYKTRLTFAATLVRTGYFFQMTKIFYQDFGEAADTIIAAGGEGCVIQNKNNPYMPGTRTAWKTLKLKQTLPHMDLKVIGVLEPTKEYHGDCAETWQYYKDGMAVTKPYYMGWKNGITILLPSGLTTDVASGLTDDDRAYLATEVARQAIAAGELWAEVKAMSINDKGALRHPALVRLRTDM